MVESMIARIIRLPLLRKATLSLRQIPRTIMLLTASSADYHRDPPILLNSFPKSGTHLLLQMLRGTPKTKYYGSFIASIPSITRKERSSFSYIQAIRRIVPGELVPAHLFHRQITVKEIKRANCVHLFLYRDLRDVAVSEAFYLSEMNNWHRLSRPFRNLESLEERISAAIIGEDFFGCDLNYPNIAERFLRYSGWLKDDSVLAMRFEDIVTAIQSGNLLDLSKQITERLKLPIQPESLSSNMYKAVDPRRSHTFREGKSGSWQNYFSEFHKRKMKEVGGDLLVELGYESNLAW